MKTSKILTDERLENLERRVSFWTELWDKLVLDFDNLLVSLSEWGQSINSSLEQQQTLKSWVGTTLLVVVTLLGGALLGSTLTAPTQLMVFLAIVLYASRNGGQIVGIAGCLVGAVGTVALKGGNAGSSWTQTLIALVMYLFVSAAILATSRTKQMANAAKGF